MNILWNWDDFTVNCHTPNAKVTGEIKVLLQKYIKFIDYSDIQAHISCQDKKTQPVT